jgi:hypothetical protein
MQQQLLLLELEQLRGRGDDGFGPNPQGPHVEHAPHDGE